MLQSCVMVQYSGLTNLLLHSSEPTLQEIHVEGEGYVLHHDHDVCHCYPCQEEVDGVSSHILVCENHDVHDVEYGAKDADGDGEVSVD